MCKVVGEGGQLLQRSSCHGLSSCTWVWWLVGILMMIRSNIFKSEGRVFEEGEGRYVAVSFRGQSFLYNQIRLMIGGALAVVTGLLPEEALDAALTTPYMIYSPLAPAEGLYLKRLTFGRQTRNTVLLDDGDRQELRGG